MRDNSHQGLIFLNYAERNAGCHCEQFNITQSQQKIKQSLIHTITQIIIQRSIKVRQVINNYHHPTERSAPSTIHQKIMFLNRHLPTRSPIIFSNCLRLTYKLLIQKIKTIIIKFRVNLQQHYKFKALKKFQEWKHVQRVEEHKHQSLMWIIRFSSMTTTP